MFYARLGQVPHKRHTQFRQPDGSLYHEELMGIHGFTGNKSLLYHLRPPTEVQSRGNGQHGRIPLTPCRGRCAIACCARLDYRKAAMPSTAGCR